MKNLLRSCKSEWLKVFTTRMWWVLALIMALYIGFTAGLMGLMISGLLPGTEEQLAEAGQVLQPQAIYTLGSSMGYLFAVIISSLSVTGEWRHGTISTTFTSEGSRGSVLVGKTLVQMVVGLMYGVIALAAATLTSVFLITRSGQASGLTEGDTWLVFIRSVLVMALWAAIGVGLGVLVRNQTAAVVIVIAFTQFLEPLARTGAAFNKTAGEIVKYLPGSAADSFVGDSLYNSMYMSQGASPLTWWQGGLLIACYAAAFLTIGWLTRWRTADVT